MKNSKITLSAIALVVLTASCIHSNSNKTEKPLLTRSEEGTDLEVIDIETVKRAVANEEEKQVLDENGRLEYIDENVVYLKQNWSANDRETFYFTPQGSHIIPEKFAKHLKTESNQKFFSSEYLKKFRFIPQKADSKLNPLGLPVGFTRDGYMSLSVVKNPSEVGQRYVGMNCAACHTSNLKFGNNTIRIDGGQALADFQGFMNEFNSVVQITKDSSDKLEKFIANVSRETKEDAKNLKDEFLVFAKEKQEWQNRNSSNHYYGGGRNDAFGVIFNQVLANDLGIAENAREPDAPVSYPFIWDAPQHDFVQWNGLASNDPKIGGPMARNVGQVLGVFGKVDFSKESNVLNGFCSSARRIGLETLEDKVRTLWSPKWPEELMGRIDKSEKSKWSQGKKLFEKNCQSCHADIVRDDPNRSIKAVLINAEEVGTDPKLNENAVNRTAKTGILHEKKRKTRVITGRLLEEEEPAAFVLKHAVASSLAGSISAVTCRNSMETSWETIRSRVGFLVENAVKGDRTPGDEATTKEQRLTELKKGLNKYKARPLNGVWSTAPFLHNGSVRTIKELLTKDVDREKSFKVGCNNFDPVDIGYNCDHENTEPLRLDIKGNLNKGHNYGTDLKPAEKNALIEYIKTI